MEIEFVIATAAIIGTVTTLLGFLAGNRERKAKTLNEVSSAAANIARAYDKLNTALEDRINALEEQRLEDEKIWINSVKSVEKLQVEINELKEKIKMLEKERDGLSKENQELRRRIKVLEKRKNDLL